MRFRFTLSNNTYGSIVLAKNPKGWEDMEFLVKRGPETHGLFYEQVVNLQFHCGAGKEYIDTVRAEQGIDGQISILIEVVCSSCFTGFEVVDYSDDYSVDYGSAIGSDCTFEEFYAGMLDLKTWASDEVYTSVEIIQSGFAQKVRNRLDTKVDLFRADTLDGTALSPFVYGPHDLTMHSKAILLTADWNDSNNYTEEIFAAPPFDTLRAELPFLTITRDEIGTAYIPSAPYLSSNNQVTQNQADIVFHAEENLQNITFTYNIVGTFNEHRSSARSYNLGIIFTKNFGLASAQNLVFIDYGPQNPSAGNNTQAINAQGTFVANLDAGDNLFALFILANYGVNSASTPLVTTISVNLTVLDLHAEVVSVTGDSTAKGFAIFEAGAKISQVISDRVDAFRSNYFGRTNSSPYAYLTNGCGSFRNVSNGFMIRGFPTTGDEARTIRMSMNEYFRSLNAIDNLGLGIEKIGEDYYITIEPKEYYYDVNTTILTLSNVPDIVISEAPDYYYSRVSIGYSKWETEFVNGLNEVNTKRQYDTGIKAVDSELSLYSDFVTAPYRIEAARRRQYSTSFTEDTEFDEDNYIICAKRTIDGAGNPIELHLAEKNENFTQINNVLKPETIYNARVTPARNYLRWNNVVNAGLTKYPSRNVRFTYGEGNYKATSEMNNDSCSGRWNNNLFGEGQDIQWDSADNSDASPIWLPETPSFKFPLSYSEFKQILSNPKGVIEVSNTDSNHIKYFIIEIKYNPAKGGLAEFKLLRAFE